MILITGATGFVGRSLLPCLTEAGYSVRCLLQPSPSGVRLPANAPVFVSLGSLTDRESIRSALAGIDTVIHLAGAEWTGSENGILHVDHAGTKILLEASVEADVRHIVYLSHLGADRASAFSIHKIKGILEEFIRQSGIPYTIVRSSLLYGPEDSFTNVMAALLRIIPGVFPLPGTGQVLMQPLWVQDLAKCLELSLGDDRLLNQTIYLGGPEFLNLDQILHIVMRQIGVRRILVPTPFPYLRWMNHRLRPFMSGSPLTSNWLDHVSVTRICEVNSLSHHFNLRPAVFEHTISYLAKRSWLSDFRLLLNR